MEKENIEIIFQKISDERDYQNHLCIIKEMPLRPTVEGELVMLKTYIDKALQVWRCLENNGCPKRDMIKGFTKGEI